MTRTDLESCESAEVPVCYFEDDDVRFGTTSRRSYANEEDKPIEGRESKWPTKGRGKEREEAHAAAVRQQSEPTRPARHKISITSAILNSYRDSDQFQDPKEHRGLNHHRQLKNRSPGHRRSGTQYPEVQATEIWSEYDKGDMIKLLGMAAGQRKGPPYFRETVRVVIPRRPDPAKVKAIKRKVRNGSREEESDFELGWF